MNAKLGQWIEEARKALQRAYAPYSSFPVGSVVIGRDGTVHYGCNVENVSYGATNCAERTALFSAIAAGHPPRSFRALVVMGGMEEPVFPCGLCRQVMVELCDPRMPVYLVSRSGQCRETTPLDLIPHPFGK